MYKSYAAEMTDHPYTGDSGSAMNTEQIASHQFLLPRSNVHSIYFAPGSPTLSETALTGLVAMAEYLKTNPLLSASLTAYSDPREDIEFGNELRKARADAVVDGLVALGIHGSRISAKNGIELERQITSCATEYCRQSYRRVGIEYFKAHKARRQ